MTPLTVDVVHRMRLGQTVQPQSQRPQAAEAAEQPAKLPHPPRDARAAGNDALSGRPTAADAVAGGSVSPRPPVVAAGSTSTTVTAARKASRRVTARGNSGNRHSNNSV